MLLRMVVRIMMVGSEAFWLFVRDRNDTLRLSLWQENAAWCARCLDRPRNVNVDRGTVLESRATCISQGRLSRCHHARSRRGWLTAKARRIGSAVVVYLSHSLHAWREQELWSATSGHGTGSGARDLSHASSFAYVQTDSISDDIECISPGSESGLYESL